MGKKRCIFHYPNPISDKMSAGSSVRPNQMLNAFKLCGLLTMLQGMVRKENKRLEKLKRILKME